MRKHDSACHARDTPVGEGAKQRKHRHSKTEQGSQRQSCRDEEQRIPQKSQQDHGDKIHAATVFFYRSHADHAGRLARKHDCAKQRTENKIPSTPDQRHSPKRGQPVTQRQRGNGLPRAATKRSHQNTCRQQHTAANQHRHARAAAVPIPQLHPIRFDMPRSMPSGALFFICSHLGHMPLPPLRSTLHPCHPLS